VNFLLDSNVVSEWARLRPDTGVVTWLAQADEDRLFISVITLAELRHGIDRMAAGRRRSRLEEWLRNELVARFETRILYVDERVADAWGGIVARREGIGRRIGVMDAFIAATAEVKGLTLVTRNEADFRPSVKSIVNPWTGD
jgi:predicted nucleic acid-binding protein